MIPKLQVGQKLTLVWIDDVMALDAPARNRSPERYRAYQGRLRRQKHPRRNISGPRQEKGFFP